MYLSLYSKYDNLLHEYFSLLEDCKSPEDYVIIGGDMNLHLSKCLSMNDLDQSHLLTNMEICETRSSKDHTLDSRGKKLISICESYGIIPLNGCSFGDQKGKYTYITSTATSVIDWILTYINTINEIVKDFKIIPRTESKHNLLELSLIFDAPKSKSCSYIKQQLLWSAEKGEIFNKNLETLLVNILHNINKTTLNLDLKQAIYSTAKTLNLHKTIKISIKKIEIKCQIGLTQNAIMQEKIF